MVFASCRRGHRNRNAAPLAIEKKCCALFFLLDALAPFPKRRLMQLLMEIGNVED
jgi:hypothetical protein